VCGVTRLYISGPMSGIEGHNFPAFDEAARALRRAGFVVINPADRGIVYGWEWEDYLRNDLVDLLACDGVATLPGSTASRGANLEAHVASSLGMRVKTVGAWCA
jgi:hypothetical protein